MRKFAEIYKEKQNRAFESNESKVVLDFKSVYSALLEKYNCVSYKKLNESHQNAFLFELNKYWTEGSGITKDGEKFLKTKSVILNEQSTVLQKKNFLKNKIKETVHENINGHDLKWKIYDILDEMYHSIKVSSINEILSVDMIDIIIRETFNDVANKFFDEIKHELNESCKTKKKYIIKKKSKKVNETRYDEEGNKLNTINIQIYGNEQNLLKYKSTVPNSVLDLISEINSDFDNDLQIAEFDKENGVLSFDLMDYTTEGMNHLLDIVEEKVKKYNLKLDEESDDIVILLPNHFINPAQIEIPFESKGKYIIKKKSKLVKEWTGEESTEEDFEKARDEQEENEGGQSTLWHGDESDEEAFEKTRDEQEENSEDDEFYPEKGDYSEAYYKIDKYMPEDPEVQEEYFEILDDVDLTKQQRIDALEEFFWNNMIDEERFFSYAPKDATIKEFAEWIVNSMEEYGPYEDIKELPVDESTINERKAKLGSGVRFSKLEKELKKGGAKDPTALVAHIGRKKYGKTKFQKLATKGK